MDIFVKVLQGSYAYLLIFQVIVVTLLLLALVAMIVRRTREVAAIEVAEPEIRLPIEVSATSDAEVRELKEKIAYLEGENNRLKAMEEQAKALREKVKYLESKLLEYEILQEEIGTLSALKLENEHLKKQISQIKDVGATPIVTESPQALASAPDQAPTATSDGGDDTPQTVGDMMLAASVDLGTPTAPPNQLFELASPSEPDTIGVVGLPEPSTPPPPVELPDVPAARASEPSAATNGDGLDGLLAQIDELSKGSASDKGSDPLQKAS